MLSQRQYIEDMAKRFNLIITKPAPTPLSSGIKLLKVNSPATPDEKSNMEDVPYQNLIGSLVMVVTPSQVRYLL